MRFNKWGKLKISFELNQRKLPKNVIIEAVSLINENEYFELLKKETKKKLRSLNDKDPYVKKGKLHRFASSKGFESDVIFKVLDDVMGDIGESDDNFSEN